MVTVWNVVSTVVGAEPVIIAKEVVPPLPLLLSRAEEDAMKSALPAPAGLLVIALTSISVPLRVAVMPAVVREVSTFAVGVDRQHRVHRAEQHEVRVPLDGALVADRGVLVSRAVDAVLVLLRRGADRRLVGQGRRDVHAIAFDHRKAAGRHVRVRRRAVGGVGARGRGLRRCWWNRRWPWTRTRSGQSPRRWRRSPPIRVELLPIATVAVATVVVVAFVVALAPPLSDVAEPDAPTASWSSVAVTDSVPAFTVTLLPTCVLAAWATAMVLSASATATRP